MTAPPLIRLPVALDGDVPRVVRAPRTWLPIAVAFAGYPILWPLGLGVLAFPLAGIAAGIGLLRRHDARMPAPAPVLVWLCFLAWTGTAVFVLGGFDRWIAFGYRATIYGAATGLLLWIVGSTDDSLSDRTILRVVTTLWVVTVIGGLVAILAPGVEVTTIVERMLPASLLQNGLIRNTVHLQIAAESRFLGFPVGRPEAPFPFTNAWGSNLALLTPMVIATWHLTPTRRWRVLTGLLGVAAIIPWIFSLNRGSWLSLSLGLAYVAARRIRRVSPRRVAALAAGFAVLVAIGLASPLGSLVLARSETGHSDAGRASLYAGAIDLTIESPVIGWGAPQTNPLNPTGASIGTHGQLWLLLVSHGVPAAILYVGFFALAWVAAFRWQAGHAVWLEATLVVAALQFPIYELMPTQMFTLVVVAGLTLRGQRDDRTDQPQIIRAQP